MCVCVPSDIRKSNIDSKNRLLFSSSRQYLFWGLNETKCLIRFTCYSERGKRRKLDIGKGKYDDRKEPYNIDGKST